MLVGYMMMLNKIQNLVKRVTNFQVDMIHAYIEIRYIIMILLRSYLIYFKI